MQRKRGYRRRPPKELPALGAKPMKNWNSSGWRKSKRRERQWKSNSEAKNIQGELEMSVVFTQPWSNPILPLRIGTKYFKICVSKLGWLAITKRLLLLLQEVLPVMAIETVP